MPIERTTKGGQPGYRWGRTGKVYTYTAGDAASREKAKKKAAAQGTAARASKNRKKKK